MFNRKYGGHKDDDNGLKLDINMMCEGSKRRGVTRNQGKSRGGSNGDGRLLIRFYYSAVTGNRKQVLTVFSLPLGSCDIPKSMKMFGTGKLLNITSCRKG